MEKNLEILFNSCPGWCSTQKAEALFRTIINRKSKFCVEIGVYGGKSLIAEAFACKSIGGVIYGIDPWSNIEAQQPGLMPLDKVNAIDFNKLYLDLIQKINNNKLNENCKLLKMKSSVAVNNFLLNSIDFLHIDGNHLEERVYEDITMYLPRVKVGGLIWFDDIIWKSTTKAYKYAQQNCKELVCKVENNAIFEKP